MSAPERDLEFRCKTILDLTGLIYDALADSSRWRLFLEAFVRAVGGTHGTLALRDANDDRFGIICWHGWSDEDIRLYVESYAAIDPWSVGGTRWPEGTVGSDFELCSREVMEESAAFREFYAPRGGIHGMGSTILVTQTGQSLITAMRGAKDGPFGEPERAILSPLMPHLKRAALLHGEFGALRRQLGAFTDHLDQYPYAFLLADTEGRVLYANESARQLAGLRDGFSIEQGCLKITSPRENAALRQAVAEVSAGRDTSLRRLTVSRGSKRTPYRAIVMPVQHCGAIPLGVSIPAVSILLLDPDSLPEPDVPALCELFSLTPAEARVAGKLALGRSVEEIASEAGLSIETVRTHIKRILSKTATERQGELISLILRSIPLHRRKDENRR
jgi:DNA-binding CsgD family transcriptional regulator